MRKREAITAPEDTWVKDPKYNSAFTLQQQSDDEDTFDLNGNLVPNLFTSRAPTSRSTKVCLH